MKKKICMLGSFAVGKTSLVRRFVYSIFSEKYLTTIGVKIDKKTVAVGDREVDLLLWDLHGEDEINEIQSSYLRGASGYLLVADGTRRATLETAFHLRKKVETIMGELPFVLILNKSDVTDEWEIDSTLIQNLMEEEFMVKITSAKTGLKVNEAFMALTEKMLET